jgi:hypothetical protein
MIMAKHRGQQAQDQQRYQEQQAAQSGQAGQMGQAQVTGQTVQPEIVPTSPLETQQFGGSPEPSAIEESTAVFIPVAPPAPVAATPKSPDLDAILASLSPDQLAKIRLKAIGEGVVPAASLGGRKSPDGSLTVTVTLDPMVTEQLELWAEADGCSLVEEAQKRIAESLSNYLYGDWNPVPEPEPAPVAAATTSVVTK